MAFSANQGIRERAMYGIDPRLADDCNYEKEVKLAIEGHISQIAENKEEEHKGISKAYVMHLVDMELYKHFGFNVWRDYDEAYPGRTSSAWDLEKSKPSSPIPGTPPGSKLDKRAKEPLSEYIASLKGAEASQQSNSGEPKKAESGGAAVYRAAAYGMGHQEGQEGAGLHIDIEKVA